MPVARLDDPLPADPAAQHRTADRLRPPVFPAAVHATAAQRSAQNRRMFCVTSNQYILGAARRGCAQQEQRAHDEWIAAAVCAAAAMVTQMRAVTQMAAPGRRGACPGREAPAADPAPDAAQEPACPDGTSAVRSRSSPQVVAE
jgi:hypothetical protein